MRMTMRRFTRLKSAFNQKAENHPSAIALDSMHYIIRQIHQNLRVTSAREAGFADHVWSLAEGVARLDGHRIEAGG